MGLAEAGDGALRAARGLFAPRRLVRRRSPPVRTIRAVEALIVIVIALLVGRTILTALSGPVIPEAPPVVAAPTAVRTAAAPDPFRTVAPAAPVEALAATEEAADTSLDLKLYGTWVDENGGSAIIGLPGGQQNTFFVDDAICCGATLAEVHPHRVIIARGGVRESLRLPDKQAVAPGPQNAQARAAARAAATPVQPQARSPVSEQGDGGDLASLVRVSPSAGPEGAIRMVIFPANGRDAEFTSLGLASGDVIVSINGQVPPTNAADIGRYVQVLQGATQAQVIVERDGVQTPIEISLLGVSAAAEQIN